MKKTYIQPSLEVVDIQLGQHLMAGSLMGDAVIDELAGDDVIGLAHEDEFDFGEENDFAYDEDNFEF